MKRILFWTCAIWGCISSVIGTNPSANAAVESEQPSDKHLTELKSQNVNIRRSAIEELLTSLDPRIPDALLPLLRDEGDSIRRLAARSIGSRWWQIPKERVPIFTKALQHNLRSERKDEKNMAERAIGLISRKYKGEMFAQSNNRRWVAYERHGLPCIIDTATFTEELIGWSSDFC
jgi:hypothetical protein